jgi:Uma2 family endonuclease
MEGRSDMTTTENVFTVVPADWVPGPQQGFWTYEDYARLPDEGKHFEVVNGVLVMAPAPDLDHQSITLRISHYLLVHVELAGLGRVFPAPVDVVLGQRDVFQPDVVVVLNAHLDRLARQKIMGAPDLVVEIASPATAAYDRLTKYAIYARSGVAEYWIVKPANHTVEVLVLERSEYHSLGIFSGRANLPSRVVPGLPACVEQFFP